MIAKKLHIRSLGLKNFRCFEKLSLDLHPKLNVFFGDNGAGKSAILCAIEIMLSTIIEEMTKHIYRNKFFYSFIEHIDILNGSQMAKIIATVKKDKHMIFSTTSKKGKNSDHEEVISQHDISALKPFFQYINKTNSLPVLVSYSAHRYVKNSLGESKDRYPDFIYSCYENAINYETSFEDFFVWFREREDAENESFRMNIHKHLVCSYDRKKLDVQSKDFRDKQLQAVRTALGIFFPNLSNFAIRRKISAFVATKKGAEFNIYQLSDGEKIYLLLVGDIARRLAIANPQLDNPLEGEGIILIDEIELHLHPKWQRMIIPQLLKTFPNCQFIVTSHSPQVLGEVKPESIWILKEGEAPHHPQYSYGLTSSEILDGDMGAASRNTDVTKALEAIDRLIDNEQFDEARNSIKALAKITGHIPAIVGSNSYLTMMGEEQAEIEED